MKMRNRGCLGTCALILALVAGCKEDEPSGDTGSGDAGTSSDDGGDNTGNDGGTAEDGGTAGDGGTGTTGGVGCGDASIVDIDENGCEPLASDYQPQVNMSADDTWPACIPDDGTYTLVDATPSSIARVEAFETVAGLLWRAGVPGADDFTAARDAYSIAEGLESRLVRREDLHYPEVPMEDWDPGVDADKQCTVVANIMKYPDNSAPRMLARNHSSSCRVRPGSLSSRACACMA